MENTTLLSAKPQTIRAQVARYPLAAFVILAYAISWTCWLLMWLVDAGTVNGFGIIGATGPALAAMIVSAVLRPEPVGVPAAKHLQLFGLALTGVLAFLVMRRLWLVAGMTVVAGRGATAVVYPTVAALALDALAAMVLAFVLSGVNSVRRGVRDLLRSLSPWQMQSHWYWFAIAVTLYPAVVVFGNTISALGGLPMPAPRATGPWYWLALEAILLFVYVLLCGGGLEEPGWRGLALQRLQHCYSPLRSSVILGVIWAFWHWPMFWFGYYGGGPLGVFLYVIGVVPISILFTAVFNRTRGSLLVVILLHTSINATPMFITPTALASSLWMLLIFCVTIWMWRSPQTFASSNRHREW